MLWRRSRDDPGAESIFPAGENPVQVGDGEGRRGGGEGVVGVGGRGRRGERERIACGGRDGLRG